MIVSNQPWNMHVLASGKVNLNILERLNSLPMPRQSLEHLFNIVLKYNIFSFGSKVFRQVRRTAMGIKMAPSYANVFMDSLKEAFLSTQETRPSMYKRYIDDILILWNHLIDIHEKNFMKTHDNPRTQRISFLTKIHKDPYGIRPIVSGNLLWHTSKHIQKTPTTLSIPSLKHRLIKIPSYVYLT